MASVHKYFMKKSPLGLEYMNLIVATNCTVFPEQKSLYSFSIHPDAVPAD